MSPMMSSGLLGACVKNLFNREFYALVRKENRTVTFHDISKTFVNFYNSTLIFSSFPKYLLFHRLKVLCSQYRVQRVHNDFWVVVVVVVVVVVHQ